MKFKCTLSFLVHAIEVVRLFHGWQEFVTSLEHVTMVTILIHTQMFCWTRDIVIIHTTENKYFSGIHDLNVLNGLFYNRKCRCNVRLKISIVLWFLKAISSVFVFVIITSMVRNLINEWNLLIHQKPAEKQSTVYLYYYSTHVMLCPLDRTRIHAEKY